MLERRRFGFSGIPLAFNFMALSALGMGQLATLPDTVALLCARARHGQK